MARSSVFWLCMILISAAALAFAVHNYQSGRQWERTRLEARQKQFNAVKQGDTSALVVDSRLLPMLADDADCRRLLTSLTFATTEIDSVDALQVAKLANVTSMTFYCTKGTKDLLLAARSLPLTELSFEGPDLKPDSYLMLKHFPHLKRVRFEQVMDDALIDRLKMEMPGVTIDVPHPASEQDVAK